MRRLARVVNEVHSMDIAARRPAPRCPARSPGLRAREAVGRPDRSCRSWSAMRCGSSRATATSFWPSIPQAEEPRGAVIIAHGRGWSPDYELYGMLRVKLAEQGYTTLAIQLPVLGGGRQDRRLHSTYPDARSASSWPRSSSQDKGYKNIAIVSHSLGATMANQYLINVKHNTGQGLGVHRHHQRAGGDVPHQDPGAGRVRQQGLGDHPGGCLRAQEADHKIRGSEQVVVVDALHFFEGGKTTWSTHRSWSVSSTAVFHRQARLPRRRAGAGDSRSSDPASPGATCQAGAKTALESRASLIEGYTDMVVIRLARGGAKKRPFFNVVVADSRNPRDGRFIERVGFYNPKAPAGRESLRMDDGSRDALAGQGRQAQSDTVRAWSSSSVSRAATPPSEHACRTMVVMGARRRPFARRRAGSRSSVSPRKCDGLLALSRIGGWAGRYSGRSTGWRSRRCTADGPRQAGRMRRPRCGGICEGRDVAVPRAAMPGTGKESITGATCSAWRWGTRQDRELGWVAGILETVPIRCWWCRASAKG